MKVKLLGKQDVDYMSRKTNKQVKGVNLHCTFERSNVEGMAVEALYLGSNHYDYDKALNFPIGADLSVEYNRFGSIESVTLCK